MLLRSFNNLEEIQMLRASVYLERLILCVQKNLFGRQRTI
jgi:hypothetical protein